MVEINVAKDILEGKRHDSDVPGPEVYERPVHKPEAIKEETITFEEAASKAGVPHSGVTWKFITKAGHSKTFNPSTSGCVLCGKTDTSHIFVSIEHYHYAPNELGDRPVRQDLFHMDVQHFPLSQSLATLAPRVIREMYSHFKFGAQTYAAQVSILKEDTAFNRDLYYKRSSGTHWVQFKDAMGILGEISPEHSWVKDRKVTCEMVIIGEMEASEEEIYGRSLTGSSYKSHIPTVALIFNGREFHAKPETCILLSKMTQGRASIIDKVFGQYHYKGTKKNVSRKQDGKKLLTWMAENLKAEPPEVLEHLKASAGSMK